MKRFFQVARRLATVMSAVVLLPMAARGAALFQDDFTRGTDPGPLSPWLVQAGSWTVTGGQLQGGPGAPSTYGYVYPTNFWSDYSVQALVKLPAGSFGCGVAARLNAALGIRYAAWIYPEGSPAGSNVLRLLKFSDWESFSVLQQVPLASVGTNAHTLQLVARGNRLAAHLDGTLVASVVDTDPQPYLLGGIDLEMWTDGTLFTMSADNVVVASPVGMAASNDTYTVRQSGTLAPAAPGVLANDAPEMGFPTALLSSGPSHGALNLNANGSFTYTPVANYIGPDSFTYRAQDGYSTSSVATVSITVTADNAPKATNDTYTLMANTLLSLPAPGILGNDGDADGDSLTASLVSGPTKGALSLNADGSFTYIPSPNYIGADSFTYRASDGLSNSAVATVSLSVTAFAPWYSDSFNRGSLAPWVVQDGNWALSNGTLVGGTNDAAAYGHAYLTNQWSDYSVQASLAFSTNGFGGGLAARLNPATGARYAAWIYPEGSPGGQSVLKLLKFQSWSQFTALQQVSLPGVGTNWHTVQLAVRGNRIAVHYDQAAVLSVIDANPPLLPSGAVSIDLWTASTPWKLSADDLTVSPILNVLATNDNYTTLVSSTLNVPAPGILANDAGDMGNLTATLVSGTAHGTVILNPTGGFTYAPNVGYTGPDSFTYRATDGVTTSGVATVAITMAAPGLLFTDDFTRTNPPGALSPWLVRTGNWAVNTNVLQGGSNAVFTYGHIYLPTNWSDYVAQARVQFPVGAYGGGLGGRVNLATGARYALWVYPENSSGGSNVWKLLKFQNWTSFTVLQQGNLPSVGTNFHTLKLSLQGANVGLAYDGSALATVTDPQPYLSGALSLEFWTDATSYQMSADDVQVTALPPDLSVTALSIVPAPDNQTATITFRGAPGGLYQVQATGNLGPGAAWLTVSTNIAGTDGRWTFTDSLVTNPRRSYRVTRP